jgi:hypothetical protein
MEARAAPLEATQDGGKGSSCLVMDAAGGADAPVYADICSIRHVCVCVCVCGAGRGLQIALHTATPW